MSSLPKQESCEIDGILSTNLRSERTSDEQTRSSHELQLVALYRHHREHAIEVGDGQVCGGSVKAEVIAYVEHPIYENGSRLVVLLIDL